MQQPKNSLPALLANFLEGGTREVKIANIAAIAVLILMVLILPPISLPSCLGGGGFTRVGRNGGSVVASDKAEVQVPKGALNKDVAVKVSVLPRADFPKNAPAKLSAAGKVPQDLTLKSPVYFIEVQGGAVPSATVSIPIPNGIDAPEKTDVYGWNGSRWEFVPGRIVAEDDRIYARPWPALPQALAIMQTSQVRPVFSASLPVKDTEAQGKEALEEASPLGLTLNTDGTVMGSPTPWRGSDKVRVIPTVRNLVGNDYDGELVSNILQNDGLRKRLVSNLAALVAKNNYAGVDIDFRKLDPQNPADRAKFSTFIGELSAELHRGKKTLTVTVEPPTQVSEDTWQTGAYDWVALGKLADGFKIAFPVDPDNFGQVQKAIAYAITQVDRYKIQPVLSLYSQERPGNGAFEPRTYAEAAQTAGKIEIKGDPQRRNVVPGQAVTLVLPNLLPEGGGSPVRWNEAGRNYRFTYKKGSLVSTIWLENAEALAQKLKLVKQYNLRGLALEGLFDPRNDQRVNTVLAAFQQDVAPADHELAILWQAPSGKFDAQKSSMDRPWTNWTAPGENVDVPITALLSNLAGTPVANAGGSLTVIVGKGGKPAPTPTPSPTPTSPSTGPTPPPTYSGGMDYGFCVNMFNDGAKALNLTRAAGFRWVKVQARWEELESSKGNVNWDNLDVLISQPAAAGLRVLLSVVTAPRWARPAGSDLTKPGPPANPSDYGDFVAAIAGRYKGKIGAMEIWNEQNLSDEWGGAAPNASAYVNLLATAYSRIKAVDPGIVVLSGGLTPTGVGPPMAVDDVTYMDQLYAAGMKPYMDAVAVHANMTNNPPDDWIGRKTMPATWYKSDNYKAHGSSYYLRFTGIRNVMVKHGDAGKKIWFTEFGWASSANPYPDYAYAAEISEEDQANFLVRAFAIAKEKGYIGPMLVWNLNYGPGAEPNDRWGKKAYGVLREDWTPRPAYSKLAAMPK